MHKHTVRHRFGIQVNLECLPNILDLKFVGISPADQLAFKYLTASCKIQRVNSWIILVCRVATCVPNAQVATCVPNAQVAQAPYSFACIKIICHNKLESD